MAQFSLDRPWAGDPWGGLFNEMRRDPDSVLNRYGGRGGTNPAAWRTGVFPAVNLYENPDGYVLTAELPGVPPDEIQVSLEGSTVTISGQRKIDYAAAEGTSVHRRERQTGSFRRAFELPVSIDSDNVEAVHRNGVLMLRLPKSPEHQPRQISINPS